MSSSKPFTETTPTFGRAAITLHFRATFSFIYSRTRDFVLGGFYLGGFGPAMSKKAKGGILTRGGLCPGRLSPPFISRRGVVRTGRIWQTDRGGIAMHGLTDVPVSTFFQTTFSRLPYCHSMKLVKSHCHTDLRL